MLQEVKVKDLSKLEDILKRNLAACKIENRTSYDYIRATATLFDAQGNIAIWVDDLGDPHVLLIVTSGKFGVLNETYCFANTIYTDESHQSLDIVREMVNTATLWAKSRNCNNLQLSSWIYLGCKDVGKVWEEFGAIPQETIYIVKL